MEANPVAIILVIACLTAASSDMSGPGVTELSNEVTEHQTLHPAEIGEGWGFGGLRTFGSFAIVRPRFEEERKAETELGSDDSTLPGSCEGLSTGVHNIQVESEQISVYCDGNGWTRVGYWSSGKAPSSFSLSPQEQHDASSEGFSVAFSKVKATEVRIGSAVGKLGNGKNPITLKAALTSGETQCAKEPGTVYVNGVPCGNSNQEGCALGVASKASDSADFFHHDATCYGRCDHKLVTGGNVCARHTPTIRDSNPDVKFSDGIWVKNSLTHNCYPVMLPEGGTEFGQCNQCNLHPDMHFRPNTDWASSQPVEEDTGCVACPDGTVPVKYFDIDLEYSPANSVYNERPVYDQGGKKVRHMANCKAPEEGTFCSPFSSINYFTKDLTCIKNAVSTQKQLYTQGIRLPDGTEPVAAPATASVGTNPAYKHNWEIRCNVWKAIQCKKESDGNRKCSSAKRVSFKGARAIRKAGRWHGGPWVSDPSDFDEELRYIHENDNLCSFVASLA